MKPKWTLNIKSHLPSLFLLLRQYHWVFLKTNIRDITDNLIKDLVSVLKSGERTEVLILFRLRDKLIRGDKIFAAQLLAVRTSWAKHPSPAVEEHQGWEDLVLPLVLGAIYPNVDTVKCLIYRLRNSKKISFSKVRRHCFGRSD